MPVGISNITTHKHNNGLINISKMKEQINVEWKEAMAFETSLDGHKFMLDASANVGGTNKGPRPKPLMLTALAGCTAMDVISILKKMRVQVEGFKVYVEGELTEEHPKQFNKMHIIYEFKGSNLPMDKIEKAVSLSEERYCGVSAIYKKVMPVTSEIKVV